MILANQPMLRLRLEKQRAKPVPVLFLLTTPVMIADPWAQVRFAMPADFSSVHDERHCWPCSGAHKEPIGQT